MNRDLVGEHVVFTVLVSTVLVAALRVREISRAAVEVLRYGTVLARYLRPRPPVQAITRYMTGRIRAGVRRAGWGRASRHQSGWYRAGWGRAGAASPPPVVVKNPAVPPPTILRDRRVRTLQGKIIARMLHLECGLECDLDITERETAVLDQYSSYPWIRRNLLTAAGCHGTTRIARDALQHRCRVVLPVVVSSLRMHGAIHHPQGASRLGWFNGTIPYRWIVTIRRMQRKHRIRPDGEIMDTLYPRSIRKEKARLDRDTIRLGVAHRYRSARITGHLARFNRYLAVLSVVEEMTTTGPIRPVRLHDALRRIPEEQPRHCPSARPHAHGHIHTNTVHTNTGGRSWEDGARIKRNRIWTEERWNVTPPRT